MPSTIPNFLNNQRSPLGTAFANLSAQLAAQPSEADQQKEADQALLGHWKMLGMKGMGEQLVNGFPADAAPSVGTGGPNVSPVVASSPSQAAPSFSNPQAQSPLGAQMQAMVGQTVPVPQPRPEPGQQMPAVAPTAEVQAPSPIAAAFGKPEVPQSPAPSAKPSIDMGQYTRNALYAGQTPENAGGYLLLGDANTYGARDPRTTNATVGAGKSYDQTAEKFDIGAANDLHKADQTAQVSRDNNAATNLTSRQNNQANIQKDFGIEQLKHQLSEGDDAAGAALKPTTLKWAAEQLNKGVPIGQLIPGMGKTSAAQRAQALNMAADNDLAAGRTGTDAAIAKVDYAGRTAESRNLGTREGTAGTAVNELSNIIPTTKALLDQVTRTGLYPVDAILNAAQNGTNDPALAKLAVSLNDAVVAHAKAINPQGIVTVQGQQKGWDMLGQVHDSKFLGSALDQMAIGAERARKAPGQTRDQMHAEMGGHSGNAPAPAQGGAENWVRGPDGKLTKAN